ncbi:haloacid dehalogenase-like hydrolase [Erysipelotrichaceae bacterium OH741_COT-311]|nr:haloacid dehalogenase-like hydrolase [Erysipelotrichaceae bacterium OH741_COT-311]
MKKTKMAIMYDFDKTLSPKDMQEFRILKTLGYEDPKVFWQEVNAKSQESRMDNILTYMFLMNEKARGFTKKQLNDEGTYIELFKGVDTWFDRINAFAKLHNIEVEHYIISSGNQEIIEGTSIAKKFKKIYACSYIYENGKAVWPARVVNYTTKTQYIFRIHKGILDECNDVDLNKWTPKEEKYIAYEHMIYIGDGLTDVPCMKVINQFHGNTIAVYHPKDTQKDLAKELVGKGRCKYMAKADYSQNSRLEHIVKRIVERVALDVELECLKK